MLGPSDETDLPNTTLRTKATQTKSTSSSVHSVKVQTLIDATSGFFQSQIKPTTKSVAVQTSIADANLELFQPKAAENVPECSPDISLTQSGARTELTKLPTTSKPVKVDIESIPSSSSETTGEGDNIDPFDFKPGEKSSTEDEESPASEPEQGRRLLEAGKPPKDQIKFIVFEEAVLDVFGHCSKCGAKCIVTMENQIGSTCKICSSCTSESGHYFEWSTGPLMNHMPVFHLLLATGILATGMESSKVLRLFSALNIPNLHQRELSNILKSYTIPAVYKIWQDEQSERMKEIEGEEIVIASDMRVDSPGHSGLFGSGSTLDMGRNLILDTQIIKVLTVVITISILKAKPPVSRKTEKIKVSRHQLSSYIYIFSPLK